MKLVWSPEMASKAYIDTVKSVCRPSSSTTRATMQCESFRDSGVAEYLSATAAGWNTRLIVETWTCGAPIATSVGLAIAAKYTRGRHVCIVPDEQSRSAYVAAMHGVVTTDVTEVVVGEPLDEALEGLPGVDFMVVDSTRRDSVRALRMANLSSMGAVLVCKNATQRLGSGFGWHGVLRGEPRVVRSVFLPVGRGLDIVHVGARVTARVEPRKRHNRWIKHIDQQSGEEHFLLKR